MKIAFIENKLSNRGTTVAVYDYAHFNETILNNQSIVITRPCHFFPNQPDVCKEVYDKFESRFKVYYYSQPYEIASICKEQGIDAIYVQKSGDPGDGLHSFYPFKTFVHCVFQPRCPHGDYYASISDWLNIQYGTNIPVLPYIVYLPECDKTGKKIDETLRETLHIPINSVVFGCYGGYDSFNIPMAHKAIDIVSKENPNIYFLFANTRQFCSPRPNIIHLPTIVDPIEKVKFINTCDAMVYARNHGETFGLAIAEFSIKNKPIFGIWDYKPDMESLMHKYVLKDNAYWYSSKTELINLLKEFTPEERDKSKGKDWNMYREYSPENVMKRFDVMIKEMLGKSNH